MTNIIKHNQTLWFTLFLKTGVLWDYTLCQGLQKEWTFHRQFESWSPCCASKLLLQKNLNFYWLLFRTIFLLVVQNNSFFTGCCSEQFFISSGNADWHFTFTVQPVPLLPSCKRGVQVNKRATLASFLDSLASGSESLWIRDPGLVILQVWVRYFIAKSRLVGIHALFERLWAKQVLFRVKNNVRQEVQYHMVYIAYCTELNLQICN